MTLTITPNVPRDWRGLPTVAEGGVVQWRVASSDPALAEAVEIRPVGNAFPAGTQPQTVSFAPGSAVHMFTQFQTLDDSIYEVDERFQFVFTPIGNTALSYAEAGGNVANNDRLPSLSIRARENTILENAADPVFRFDVTRAGEDLSVTTDAEISFRGVGPTPAESGDFAGALAGLSPQLVRFAPGETIKTLELQIANDAAIEATESLDAYFSRATSTSPTSFGPSPSTIRSRNIRRSCLFSMTIQTV